MLTVAGIRMRMSFAVVMVGVAASVTVMALIAVAAWPTRNSWFAADASVGAVTGIRMRRSCAAVMVGVAASVTVIAAIAAGAWPTTKTWFAADAMVGAPIWIVRLSLAFVPLPAPPTTSCR